MENNSNNSNNDNKNIDIDNLNLNGVVLDDLESVNDDFVQEIKEKDIQKKEEIKKKHGEIEDEKKSDDYELEPLKVKEELSDIMELNADNINEFLKSNNIETKVEEVKEKKVEVEEEKSDIKFFDGLKNFKLDNDLWGELNFSNEINEKVKNRVKTEIKMFVLNNLISIIKGAVK